MSLLEQLQQDVKAAMKARDQLKTQTLRMVVAELKKAAIDKRLDELDEASEIAVVGRAVKQRREAAAAYDKAEANDRAAAERAEAELLEGYLPPQASDDEVAAAVAEIVSETGASSAKDMGRVMGPLMKRFQGQLDGNRARQAVQAALSAGE